MVLGMFFFGYSDAKGEGTVLVNPEKSGLRNSSEAKTTPLHDFGGI